MRFERFSFDSFLSAGMSVVFSPVLCTEKASASYSYLRERYFMAGSRGNMKVDEKRANRTNPVATLGVATPKVVKKRGHFRTSDKKNMSKKEIAALSMRLR